MKKQIKVAYFLPGTPKDKVLSSNGKNLDKYCIKSTTDEDLSTGNYICDLTFLVDDNLQDILQEEVILKVLLDYGYEIFRISKVTVGTRYIDVVARQITIADSLTLWLEDIRPTNINGQGAVSWMLDKAEGKNEIQILSDIDTMATAYYQRMSLYKALHDNDNSFLNRWGGEIQRRGYTIRINKRIGIDRGFSIREGKNLIGFECASNIDNLVTRARGQGFNGILGSYIDSPLIGSYNRIYTDVIKYEDIKVKDETSEEGYDTLEEAQEELDRRINEEFSKNGIDKIKASYTINFVQLEKTEEYKNYIVAERVFLGDTIRVYIPKLNTDIKVRAMSKKYDVLAQKTKEINLSNYIEVKPLSLKQIAERLETMDSTETILQLAKDNATSLIKGGLKNSYVIVRENEIIIGDTKDINTMTKVWRWNNGGLGFSSTGYYGEFGTAVTQDGAIVADFITTGILNAKLIKAGVLKSFNNTTWINMEDGTFNFADKVKFDGKSFDIDLSSKDLATGTQVKAIEEGLSSKVSKGKDFTTEFTQTSKEFNFAIGNDETDVNISKYGLRVKNGAIEIVDSNNEALLKGTSRGNLLLKDGAILIKEDLSSAYGERLELTKRGIGFVGENGESAEVVYGLYNDACWYLTSSEAGINDKVLSISQTANISRLISNFVEATQLKGTSLTITEGISVGTGGTINGTLNTRKINTQGYDINLDGGTLYGDVEGGEITGDIYIYRGGVTRPAVRSNGTTNSVQVNGIAVRGSSSPYLEIQTMDEDVYGISINVSDRALKENITQIDSNLNSGITTFSLLAEETISSIEEIKKIKHYSYSFKEPEKYGEGSKCGYIAQELKEIDNNFAFTVEQEDGSEIYYPNFNNIVPYITLALKEQQQQIDRQLEYINTLEERIERLEGLING
ncbi:phage tail spike protein [Clostridium tertium]|uniref:phage tail spike protein n=1 Tax=Clostridium tertium TaxID=1559 RepID=UPI0024B35E03|nr:phage tail spike protein [Clostridium tertium]MDI9215940.1 phage tail protein [Clostridium tertium]